MQNTDDVVNNIYYAEEQFITKSHTSSFTVAPVNKSLCDLSVSNM